MEIHVVSGRSESLYPKFLSPFPSIEEFDVCVLHFVSVVIADDDFIWALSNYVER